MSGGTTRRAKVRAAQLGGVDAVEVSDDGLLLTVTLLGKAPHGLGTEGNKISGFLFLNDGSGQFRRTSLGLDKAGFGAFAFTGEMAEGSGAQSLGRLAFVASVFVGLGLAGLVIAYAFLGEPLGLTPRS